MDLQLCWLYVSFKTTMSKFSCPALQWCDVWRGYRRCQFQSSLTTSHVQGGTRILQILPLGHWILNIYFPPTQSLHEEAVATLCTEKDWWCELCKRPATDGPNSVYKVCTLSINQLISCLFNYYPQIKLICVCVIFYSIPTSRHIPGTDLQRSENM